MSSKKKLTETSLTTHQANVAKETLFITLSHELRTSLTPILSWAQLLQTKEISETLKQGLQVIEKNALKQAKLIDNLLHISQVSLKNQSLREKSKKISRRKYNDCAA